MVYLLYLKRESKLLRGFKSNKSRRFYIIRILQKILHRAEFFEKNQYLEKSHYVKQYHCDVSKRLHYY